MADDISSVVSGLNDLNTATIRGAIEFKGFTKSLTKAAAGTEGASKAWTTFSRLVSGTPLWAMQNKFRAYLAILAGFENRSKANSKAMKEEDKKLVQKMKGMQKVNAEYKDMIKSVDDLAKVGKGFMDLTTAVNHLTETDWASGKISINGKLQKISAATKDAIENTLQYQTTLAATGNTMQAVASATIHLTKRKKELEEEEGNIRRAAKEAYAFDNKRVKQMGVLAKNQAKQQKMGTKRRMFKMRKSESSAFVKKSKKGEKKLQKGQKKKVLSASYKDNLKGSMGSIKDFKPLLAPLAPLKGMFALAKNRKKYQMRINKFTAKAKPILNMAFKYFLFGLMAIVALMTLIPFLYGAWKTFQSLPIMDDIKDFGGRLIDFGKQIFDVINTFATVGLDEGVKKLGPLFDTGLGLLIDGIKGIAKISWMLVNFAWKSILDFFDKIWNDTAFREMVFDKIFTIGKIILAAWFVKTLIANAIQLAGMLAIPLMIGVVLVSGLILFWERYGLPWLEKLPSNLAKMASFLLDKYLGWAEGVGTIIESTLVTLWNYVKSVLADIKDALTDDPDKGWWDENKSLIGLAAGGITAGNYNLVGEQGPELVKLPAGSRVYSNSQSKSMNTGGSTVINNHITINARDTSDGELRRIADKIGTMVNNKINRTTSSRTMG